MRISIGELAARSEVKIPTIRYYEQIGLMPIPLRTSGQQRRYGATEVARLNFIRHARDLGLEVEDIRELLALSSDPNRPCKDADKIVSHHLAEVELRIAKLQSLRTELMRMVKKCDGKRMADCRVIEALADHSRCIQPHHRPN